MLHYKGLITEEPGIKAKPIGNSDKNIMETLMFYDDELYENSCDLVQERLQEHFQSEPEDVFIQVYYEKKDDRAIIGMTIFFDKKEDRSKLFTKYKSSFEKYYKKTFSYPRKYK
jgi:hypothetical protein